MPRTVLHACLGFLITVPVLYAIAAESSRSAGFVSIPKPAMASAKLPSGLDARDFASIRDAYETGRHAAFPVNGGFNARNPGQRWNTQFDGRGFLVKPDHVDSSPGGDWSWGLELQSYGITGNERPVSKTTNVTADGQRVLYQWDSNLTEWYKNDSRGLEHGYTVQSRPSDSVGTLTFNLGVRGDLCASIQNNGRDISFVNSSNASVLNYSGLTVIDADGKTLPAHFESTKNGLQLSVIEKDAHYPLTIDPIAQQAYLKASNSAASDTFGESVAISGDTVVVGAPEEDSNATGVDGNQSDNSANGSGAVYVFVRKQSTWSQQAYLKASNAATFDQFGISVAISGDTIVVGSPAEDSNSTGVNGDQLNNLSTSSGAAYVFVRSGTTWTQQAYLKASNTGSNDAFGSVVAISGDTIVVGAKGEDGGATGVNGNGNDNTSPNSGAAYVFARSGTTWGQQAYLKASNTGSSDSYGGSVAVSGDTIVVGSHMEDSNSTGVDGDQINNSAQSAGAAYVYLRNGSTWSQQAYLKASNTDSSDFFGISAAISGDTIVIGAQGESGGSTGVNGNQLSNTISSSGAAYVFVRVGTTWTQQAYLKASNTGMADLFGHCVSASGNLVVVTAPAEDSNTFGINGNQSSNTTQDAGAAYVFVRNGSTWSQLAYLKSSNPDISDEFGASLGLSGDTVIIGARFENSNATGVNGNQANNTADNSGAGYVFDLDTNPGTLSYGTGTPGCAGPETLDVTHAPIINSPDFTITCSNAPPLSMGLGIITDSQDVPGSDAFGVGVLIHSDFVFATELLTVDFFSDGTGYSETVGATIPNNPLIVGNTYYASALWAWPTSTCVLPGFNPYNLSTSRGLAITILVP